MDVAVQDGALLDGAVLDGAVQDGAVQDGAVLDGALLDGALLDDPVVVLLCVWALTVLVLAGSWHRARGARATQVPGAVVGGGRDVADLRAELQRLVALVHELDAAGAQRFGAVDARLEQATRTSRDLAQATAGLREALASSRAPRAVGRAAL